LGVVKKWVKESNWLSRWVKYRSKKEAQKALWWTIILKHSSPEWLRAWSDSILQDHDYALLYLNSREREKDAFATLRKGNRDAEIVVGEGADAVVLKVG